MDAPKPFSLMTCLLLLSLILSGWRGAEGSGHNHHRSHRKGGHLSDFRPTKLFVFGDSYADTGNTNKSATNAWKIPYGITFPGKPAGRFSDGLISPDYFAKRMGTESPTPYQFIRNGSEALKYGVNFAFGGTGVFDTGVGGPNMTSQIGQLQQLLHDGAFTPADLQGSAALVSVAGNDYIAYLRGNGSAEGLPAFIGKVVDQVAVDLRRIHSLGVKRIFVGGLHPVGCTPPFAISPQRCNGTLNLAAGYHNFLLEKAVAGLNSETKDSAFVILDMYDAFMTAFKNHGTHRGESTSRFPTPFTPCCVGISSKYQCGDRGDDGEIKYTVCRNPAAAFFWDPIHPTHAGWAAVYAALPPSIGEGV